MLLRAGYSQGNLYVMTIPDDMGNLYDLPQTVLNSFRSVLSRDLDVRIEAPAKVSLFLYDNGTFIVESFLDEPVTIQIVTSEDITSLTDMLSGAVLEKLPAATGNRWQQPARVNRFRITLKPHSYNVLKK